MNENFGKIDGKLRNLSNFSKKNKNFEEIEKHFEVSMNKLNVIQF